MPRHKKGQKPRMTLREVARELGMPHQTVHVLERRALAKMFWLLYADPELADLWSETTNGQGQQGLQRGH